MDGFGSLTHGTCKLRIFQKLNTRFRLFVGRIGMTILNNFRFLPNLTQESIQCLYEKLSFMTRWKLYFKELDRYVNLRDGGQT